MPLFSVEYSSKFDTDEHDNPVVNTVYLVAKNVEDAAKQVRAKREDDLKRIESVERLGLILNRPASARKPAAVAAPVPSWTSRSGKTKPISKIKTSNLRAIQRRVPSDSGLYTAIADELASR